MKHASSKSSSDHDGGRIRPRNPMSKAKDKQVQSELPVRKELNKYKHMKKDLQRSISASDIEKVSENSKSKCNYSDKEESKHPKEEEK